MLYMVTFTISIPQMLAYIMDPMGYSSILSCRMKVRGFSISPHEAQRWEENMGCCPRLREHPIGDDDVLTLGPC